MTKKTGSKKKTNKKKTNKKKTNKKKKSTDKVIFICSHLACVDEQILSICDIANRLGVDFNESPLMIAGLGANSRRRVVSHLDAWIKAAKKAGFIPTRKEFDAAEDDIDVTVQVTYRKRRRRR